MLERRRGAFAQIRAMWVCRAIVSGMIPRSTGCSPLAALGFPGSASANDAFCETARIDRA
jgi:hypothetical protein